MKHCKLNDWCFLKLLKLKCQEQWLPNSVHIGPSLIFKFSWRATTILRCHPQLLSQWTNACEDGSQASVTSFYGHHLAPDIEWNIFLQHCQYKCTMMQKLKHTFFNGN